MNESPKDLAKDHSNSQAEILPPENSTKNSESTNSEKPIKPPKPEDKPFEEFIKEEFIPTISKALAKKGINSIDIKLVESERPVVGGSCWQIYGEFDQGRRFWISFNDKKITSQKTIVLAERGSNPSLLESFLIDEKKTTLALLTSRLLQRLNGQKWLEAN